MDSDSLNTEILRLAAELRIEKSIRDKQKDTEKLLWDLHKTQLEYAEQQKRFLTALRSANQAGRAVLFRSQLSEARQKLEGCQMNIDIAQNLVHQLDGESRSHSFHINVDELKRTRVFGDIDTEANQLSDNINTYLVEALVSAQNNSEEIGKRMTRVQENIKLASDAAILSACEGIHVELVGNTTDA